MEIQGFFQTQFAYKRALKEMLLIQEIRQFIPNFIDFIRKLKLKCHYFPDTHEIWLQITTQLFFKLPVDTIRIVPGFQGFRYECWRGSTEFLFPKQQIYCFLLQDLLDQLCIWQDMRRELIENRAHPRHCPKFSDWGWEGWEEEEAAGT